MKVCIVFVSITIMVVVSVVRTLSCVAILVVVSAVSNLITNSQYLILYSASGR